ncbi:kinase-like protein, partial [Clavulina sp. PMI_390]
QLLHREAITHSLLNHPNILPFLGIYHDRAESPPLMVLPLIERGSLQELLTGPLIDPTTLRSVLLGVGCGVAYLHSRRPLIVHGDLHPGNVLVDFNGKPYLCDFGLSRIRHEVTRTRTVLQQGGRRRFIAPEIISAKKKKSARVTPASDLFSLAMTFLNTWSGQAPFHELANFKAESYLRKGGRPSMPNADQTRCLWDLLNQMWAQVPSSRPSSQHVVFCLEKI